MIINSGLTCKIHKHLDSSVSQLRITKSTFDKGYIHAMFRIALILTVDTPSPR